MARSKKARRIQMLIFGGIMLATAAALVGFMGQDAIAFFKSPTELVAESSRPDQLLRVGGMVVEGTSTAEGATRHFDVTDGNNTVSIAFTGVLPDLFREGQGIVAQGYWNGSMFEATEVLAKHDENYMPRELEGMMAEQGSSEGTRAAAATLAAD